MGFPNASAVLSLRAFRAPLGEARYLVAHDCGYPLSRYTCRATRLAADFSGFYSVVQV